MSLCRTISTRRLLLVGLLGVFRHLPERRAGYLSGDVHRRRQVLFDEHHQHRDAERRAAEQSVPPQEQVEPEQGDGDGERERRRQPDGAHDRPRHVPPFAAAGKSRPITRLRSVNGNAFVTLVA